MKILLRIFLALAAAFSLSACYDGDEKVTLHKAGVYKGKPDSAAILHSDDSAREELIARFRAVQTDR